MDFLAATFFVWPQGRSLSITDLQQWALYLALEGYWLQVLYRFSPKVCLWIGFCFEWKFLQHFLRSGHNFGGQILLDLFHWHTSAERLVSVRSPTADMCIIWLLFLRPVCSLPGWKEEERKIPKERRKGPDSHNAQCVMGRVDCWMRIHMKKHFGGLCLTLAFICDTEGEKPKTLPTEETHISCCAAWEALLWTIPTVDVTKRHWLGKTFNLKKEDTCMKRFMMQIFSWIRFLF